LTHLTRSGKKSIVHRFPLYSSNEIIGAMSITGFKDATEMEIILRKYHLLKDKLEYYEKELQSFRSARYSFADIISGDRSMLSLIGLGKRYARSTSPVLITGETGTGKELFAHAIHLASPRKNGPFVRINCASIPGELLESELFGYEPGAFTGAKKGGKAGKFELADSGTIFLDEIGSMDLEMQAKLLRVLQDKHFERLGSNVAVEPDFRVISATNKNLEELVKEEKFRMDLYYRLMVLSLDIPPLRKRRDDVRLLSEHFAKALKDEIGIRIKKIDEKAMGVLLNWHWPGNVRELKNVMERAANHTETGVVGVSDLPGYLLANSESRNRTKTDTEEINLLKKTKARVEKDILESTLNDTHWNKSQAARVLHISRPLLYLLIKKYDLKRAT
jgi:transcriptional regulator with PAS, ATPase and Fis domain